MNAVIMQPAESSSVQELSRHDRPELSRVEERIFYPDSDGEPMANNTKHYELITTTKSGLDTAFQDRDDVFVAADLFWYPVKGSPKVVVAPDVMVAFDRPKGARKSYKQWEEADTPFHIVFEFLSDANTPSEMSKKAMFFDRHGVEEYYLYDMEYGFLTGFIRYGGGLQPIEPSMNGWVSPRLGIRFEVVWSGGQEGYGEPELILYHANGKRFLSYLELVAEYAEAQSQRDQAQAQRDQAQVELVAERERSRLLEEKLRTLGISL